ncbi:MAG: penicillin-binding transpeptidase domain-containing protein [Candidatus Omnitrophica bacterium]|nr:penicillin-binding transpeptidase domain-containing protein [Candidatus Omnitrophota bacterium]
MYIVNYRRRTNAVFFFFFAFLALCIARLFFIQFFRSNYFAEIAQKQHSLFVELEPRRGTIFDCNFKPQAVNVSADSLYASPNSIPDKDKEAIIRGLSSVLGMDKAFLRDRLYRKKSFVWVARKLSPSQSEAVKKLNIKGLDFIKESRRSYPNSYLASQAVGFCGLDNTGLEGIELGYNKYLKGAQGWALVLRDARQKKLNLEQKMALPADGYNLVLTIDEVIQYIAERELDKAFKTFHAKGASLVAIDPHTGAILAMVNRPTFDLNQYNNSDKDNKRNRSISDLFEPGSVFKIVTASAALEENKVTEEDKFFCENGAYRVGGRILHDHQPHGTLTFRQVIEESSNIGTTKVAQILGPELVYRYIKLFGFGTKTGVDLPGEISGMIKEPRFWSRTSISAIPIGQEVGVTTLQLAAGLSVIANGGELMKPYIVKEIRDKHGETIKFYSPVLVRRAISQSTANRVKKILTGVVEEGTGRLAKITGFTSAGKTGTAQKLEPNGAYSHSKFVASFIGFAPAEDPVIVIAVVVDEPHPYYFGGVVAAPVFKNVAGDVLKYLRGKHPGKENFTLDEGKRAN